MRYLLLISFVLLGCSKSRPAGMTAAELTRAYKTRSWTDHEDGRAGRTTRVTKSARIEGEPGLVARCKGRAVVTRDVSGDGEPRHSYQCHDEAGFSHYAFVVPRENVRKVYTAKYELRALIRIGDAWTAVHGQGADANTRSCLVETTRYCSDGVSTVCVTAFKTDRLVWMRQHFCRGEGWRGYEGVVVQGDATLFDIWSSNVVVDGKEFPNATPPSKLPGADGIRADLKRIKAALPKVPAKAVSGG